MIEFPLSVIAWVSVVLIQAIAHFTVLGKAKGRPVAVKGEDPALEDSLTLATIESADESETSFTWNGCDCQGTSFCFEAPEGEMLPSFIEGISRVQ